MLVTKILEDIREIMMDVLLEFSEISRAATQLAFTCPKLTIKTLEQGVKRHTRMTPSVFTPCSNVSIANFEHVITG